MNYRLSKHFYIYGRHYLLLFVIFLFGFSSGVWFYRIENTDALNHAVVLLLQSACVNINECFSLQMVRMSILMCVILLAYGFKRLFWLGHVSVFAISAVFGAGICAIFSSGIVELLFSCTVQLFQIVLIMYLVSVNNSLIYGKRGNLAFSDGRKKFKILISVFLLIILQIFISSVIVVKINFI
jgi:hypothetical protein